jgi:hypothetical protein
VTDQPPEEYNTKDYVAAQSEAIRKAFEDAETKDEDEEEEDAPPTPAS